MSRYSISSYFLIYHELISYLSLAIPTFLPHPISSAFLPRWRYDEASAVWQPTDEGIYNVSLCFSPRGVVDHVAHKVHLTSGELFLDGASLDDLRVWQTALGSVGVIVCADSWFPQVYGRLERERPTILAVPTFIAPAA